MNSNKFSWSWQHGEPCLLNLSINSVCCSIHTGDNESETTYYRKPLIYASTLSQNWNLCQILKFVSP